MLRLHPVVLGLLSLAGVASLANAQCATDWLPGDPYPGVVGEVFATIMHDADGPGPQPARLIIGGQILGAGHVDSNGVVAWDPATREWSPMSGGFGGGQAYVHAFAVLPNNDLVAAGRFPWVNGYWDVTVARWNGSLWSPMNDSVYGTVSSMVVLPNGDLVVGGSFSWFSGSTWLGQNLARWDGTSWSPMGVIDEVKSLAVLPNGDLLAAGDFLAWPNGDILQWNGTAWTAFASPMSYVRALTTVSNGDVVCDGDTGNGTTGVHRWSGTAWVPMGGASDGLVKALCELPNGDLVAGGEFSSIDGVPALGLARWDGVSWHSFGAGGGGVNTITPSPSGGLYVGGSIQTQSGLGARIAECIGTSWSRLGNGTDGDVKVALDLANGDLVAVGWFREIGGVVANGIARWDGTSWTPLGSGFDGEVLDLVEMPNGDVVACGDFTDAGGVAVTNLARWNGSSWLSMGWSTPVYGGPTIRALAVMPNGDLMIGGDFIAGFAATDGPRCVARYDGTTWHSVGVGPVGRVFDMVVTRGGDLVVGGEFVAVEQPWTWGPGVAAPRVARWNGTNWLPMGSGMNARVDRLTVTVNGDVIAGGPFTIADGNSAITIARWNGTSWSGIPLIAGVSPLAFALPDGDIVGVTSQALVRWDGVQWSPMAPLSSSVGLHGLTMRRNGELFVGGSQMINGELSSGYARLATNCPALANDFALGCPSSGGNNSLAAEVLPYAGGTFVSLGTGLPASAVVIGVTGFQPLAPTVPLAVFLPVAGAGCSLAVAPDILQVAPATAGRARDALSVPATAATIGVQFLHQMVVLEVDLVGIVASTSTNALQLTVGVF